MSERLLVSVDAWFLVLTSNLFWIFFYRRVTAVLLIPLCYIFFLRKFPKVLIVRSCYDLEPLSKWHYRLRWWRLCDIAVVFINMGVLNLTRSPQALASWLTHNSCSPAIGLHNFTSFFLNNLLCKVGLHH